MVSTPNTPLSSVVSISIQFPSHSAYSIPPTVFATDLGHELFIAAAVIGNTLSALVEEVASTQGRVT